MTSRTHSHDTVYSVDRATCPHCWHRFVPEDVLAVARHTSLRSPSVVEGALRFRPSRFTESGNPIDPMGEECRELACPRCHLVVGRPVLDTLQLFMSIVGAPASGKSYFLAAALWSLRQRLVNFGWALTDASPTENAIIQANEQRLFLSDDPNRPVMLAKTDQSGGELYSRVDIRGLSEVLLRPFQFLLTPTPDQAGRETTNRLIVLYDNAGEHFLPGSSMGLDATRHMAHSKVIMFLLDPTQDPRLRAICRGSDPQMDKGPRGGGFGQTGFRQEMILAEMAHRVRTLRNIPHDEPIDTTLIVILAKADLYEQLGAKMRTESPVTPPHPLSELDTSAVTKMSSRCRSLLRSTCPEFVACAEAAAKRVLYVPVSALGGSPEETTAADGSVFFGIRPSQVRPLWVEVPFLAALNVLDRKGFRGSKQMVPPAAAKEMGDLA